MSKGTLIHQIARCSDCGKQWDHYLTARQNGYNHHKKTGHEVCVETGTAFHYKRVESKDPTMTDKEEG